jgi:hypothetical protein
MTTCQHHWEMTDIQFGFVVFEKCFHCNSLRTYFTAGDAPVLGDKYREGDCYWSRVENAQSFTFNLKCVNCGQVESFTDLMGLLHCTGCLADCRVEVLQQELERERTRILVGFGFLPKVETHQMPASKLDVLADYFNQRRDTSRSRIKIVSADLIDDLSCCRGDFIHDVGMLSMEPPTERKTLF